MILYYIYVPFGIYLIYCVKEIDMNKQESTVAFITGANRGIGFETAKKLGELGISVILGVRELANGDKAVNALKAQGINAEAIHYDAADVNTTNLVHDYINQHYGKLDILINNAGILLEPLGGVNESATVSQTVLRNTFDTNLFAVIALTQTLLPLIKKSSNGRIVNLSSILGSQTLHSMPNSPIDFAKAYAYNASKSALNLYTIHLAHALKNTNIKVNSAHPGWVKTALGGESAPMEVADSYKTSVQLATLAPDGPTGGFFHDTDTLPW
jgi:NAD(P)-dependent dehydrogenase (short-subunit alcohol dehydrogenase family)